MRIDISLLPALAAAFMLVFARIGAMVMLLPGFGEVNIPVRVRLGIALMLTLIAFVFRLRDERDDARAKARGLIFENADLRRRLRSGSRGAGPARRSVIR